jgi:FkbM family methyltransferase
MTFKLLKTYFDLLTYFRNGWELIRALRGGPPCQTAILWNGIRLIHPPGRGGLVDVLVEVWLQRTYTPSEFYRPCNGDVVVDVGANVGLFTVWMSRQNPRCRVVALEPFNENFRCLKANIEVACPQRAVAHQVALGAASGRGHMRAVGERSLDHRLSLNDITSVQETVPVISLAGLFDLAQTDRIALVKVDIEGGERETFEHAKTDTLRRLDHLAIEYHDHLQPGTLNLLQRRLAATHRLTTTPSVLPGCGILLATRL